MSSEERNSEDEELFYPIVDIREDLANSVLTGEHKPFQPNKPEDRAERTASHRKVEKINHRKVIRRKLEEDIFLSEELDRISKAKQLQVSQSLSMRNGKPAKSCKKPKKNKKKTKPTRHKHKEGPVIENGFEFCSPSPSPSRAAGLKRGSPTPLTVDKSENESDDDIPLSRLESTKLQVASEGSQRTCAISADRVSSRVGKVKKLRIKKIEKEERPESGSGFEDAPQDRKGFSCDVCSKVLSSATSLEDHQRLHTGEKPNSCNICGKLFARERDARLHMNLHREAWKCDRCQRCFVSPSKLREHYRSHTGDMPYECDQCERKFARAADYRYHIGTHLGVKPFGCAECGTRFTSASSATRHALNAHARGPRAFPCPRCPKCFHTQARLNTHLKNHENKAKFQCEQCPASRSSAAELAKHVAVHGEAFRCDTCHRGCSSAARLAAHAARHELAGKPYACFVCSLGYRSRQNLRRHLAARHPQEDVPSIAPQHLCTLCGQVFEMKDKLNRHLKDNHIVLVIGDISNLRPVKAEDLSEDTLRAGPGVPAAGGNPSTPLELCTSSSIDKSEGVSVSNDMRMQLEKAKLSDVEVNCNVKNSSATNSDVTVASKEDKEAPACGTLKVVKMDKILDSCKKSWPVLHEPIGVSLSTGNGVSIAPDIVTSHPPLFDAKDLSLDSKISKSIPRVLYNDTAAAHHDRILKPTLKDFEEPNKHLETFPQISSGVELPNPWFLGSKPIDKSTHREMLQRYGSGWLPEQLDYQRELSQASPGDRKYNLNLTNQELKNYLDPFNQKQNIRDYQHTGRDFSLQSTLVRELSSDFTHQLHHYPHHLAPNAPHNLFRDFRHLQQRMFGQSSIQNHSLRLPSIPGAHMPRPSNHQHMDMAMNTSSTLRQSYDGIPNGFPGNVGTVQNGDQHKEGGGQPLEMRVASS